MRRCDLPIALAVIVNDLTHVFLGSLHEQTESQIVLKSSEVPSSVTSNSMFVGVGLLVIIWAELQLQPGSHFPQISHRAQSLPSLFCCTASTSENSKAPSSAVTCNSRSASLWPTALMCSADINIKKTAISRSKINTRLLCRKLAEAFVVNCSVTFIALNIDLAFLPQLPHGRCDWTDSIWWCGSVVRRSVRLQL